MTSSTRDCQKLSSLLHALQDRKVEKAILDNERLATTVAQLQVITGLDISYWQSIMRCILREQRNTLLRQAELYTESQEAVRKQLREAAAAKQVKSRANMHDQLVITMSGCLPFTMVTPHMLSTLISHLAPCQHVHA